MKKCYVHEIATVNLSKLYFLKNVKKTCKPSNHDLNRDSISFFTIERLKRLFITTTHFKLKFIVLLKMF